MDRATGWRHFDDGKPPMATCEIDISLAVEKLAKYEDTGLEPEQIQEAVDLLEYPLSETDIPREFSSWVERCVWHVRKCDELLDEIKELKAENNAMMDRCKHYSAKYRDAKKKLTSFRRYVGCNILDALEELDDIRSAGGMDYSGYTVLYDCISTIDEDSEE